MFFRKFSSSSANTEQLTNKKIDGESTQEEPRYSRFNEVTEKIFFFLPMAMVGFFWVFLLVKDITVQIIKGPIYQAQVDAQHSVTETTQGSRGRILDRNGIVLANSVKCLSLFVRPNQIPDLRYAAGRLGNILNKDPEKLYELFSKKRAFTLVQKLDDASAIAIEKEHILGLELISTFQRVYPFKHLAGQLLGFVNVDGKGIEGIEYSCNSRLSGSVLKQRLPRNPVDRFLFVQDEETQKGEDVQLTIDAQVQFIAEDVISKAVQNNGAQWGGVLLCEVESGDILAWAQYPFFNPNAYNTSDAAIYRNRLSGDAIEPGSTFKPILMAAALQEGVVTPETSIFCEHGLWRTKLANIRDDTHAFGNLTATEIISHSSNIGAGKIGLMLGKNKFHSYLSQLGFGKKLGIGVHESKGIVRRIRDWSELDLISASFGQSVSVTPLQLLHAFVVLASGGVSRNLNLIKNNQSSDSSERQKNIFTKQSTEQIMKMMLEVVEGKGTGKKARISGVHVAGKTGTAQKAVARQKGYSEKRTASFIGIVPADKPKFVVYVLLDEPTTTGYGGAIAAPVFQQVASRTLAYSGFLPDPALAESQKKQNPVPEKKLTPAQKRQKIKDQIYLANLAKYRAAKAEKEMKKQNQPVKKTNSNAGSQKMPAITDISLRKAIEICVRFGLNPTLEGEGTFVKKQSPNPGESIENNKNCTLWLSINPD